MTAIVVVTTVYLAYTGYSFYALPLESRIDHPQYHWFKPSGKLGHGLGILGTLLILFGVVMYIVRKRNKRLQRLGRLKHWLEFHIFLCTLGPVMVLFHTSFKFGGIVSIAFWSMVAVVASGVLGRFIYQQIPRSIEGRELSLGEVQALKSEVRAALDEQFSTHPTQKEKVLALLNTEPTQSGNWMTYFLSAWLRNRSKVKEVTQLLKHAGMPSDQILFIAQKLAQELSLTQKLGRLQYMQKLFRYWHVAHLPFALIMLVIVVIHVAVTLMFGYKWVF
jgi:RNase P protein component